MGWTREGKSPAAMGGSVLLAMCLMIVAACARGHLRTAEDLTRNRQYEEALNHYLQALKANPDDIDLRIDIDRLLKEASLYYHALALEQERMKKSKMAVFLYKKSLEFDPANNRSRTRLALLIDPGSDTCGSSSIQREMDINVELPAVFRDRDPVNLDFKGPVGLKRIFTVLARTSGINILFDSGFRDRKVSLKLVDTPFRDALQRLCTLFRCDYHVLDGHNIVVTAENAESRLRFRPMVMKNLFFVNVEAQAAKQVIESLIRPEKLIVNPVTNSLIVADSLERIALVEKVARFVDKRGGEVEIEVEILEVDRKRLQDYGTELSTYQIGARVEGFEEGKRANDLFHLGSDDLIFTMPRVVWKFFSSVTHTRILAQPRVRGLDGEKMEIKLGEKRPILRTSFVPQASGSLDSQPINSYDMRDVGIALTLTPRIHHNHEITVRLNFELTYVTDLGGTHIPPTLGNRRVSTTLRLGHGETGIIAGLMRGTSTEGSDGLPLLGSIPLIKEIFTSRTRTRERSDILLSITPRIIRRPEITHGDRQTYSIGTGGRVELKAWKPAGPDDQ